MQRSSSKLVFWPGLEGKVKAWWHGGVEQAEQKGQNAQNMEMLYSTDLG